MDLRLTSEQKALYDDISTFADEVIAPQAAYNEQNEIFPKEILTELGKRGYLGVIVPEEFGGMGADNTCYRIVCEETSRGCGSTGITVAAHNTLGTQQIFLMGNEEQKECASEAAARKASGVSEHPVPSLSRGRESGPAAARGSLQRSRDTRSDSSGPEAPDWPS